MRGQTDDQLPLFHLFSVEDFRYRATKISLALVYVLPLLRFFIK